MWMFNAYGGNGYYSAMLLYDFVFLLCYQFGYILLSLSLSAVIISNIVIDVIISLSLISL